MCLPFALPNNQLFVISSAGKSLLCDFVGVHGCLGTTENLQSELLDIGAGRDDIRNCLILWVLNFEL
jgi:hypothetical protein